MFARFHSFAFTAAPAVFTEKRGWGGHLRCQRAELAGVDPPPIGGEGRTPAAPGRWQRGPFYRENPIYKGGTEMRRGACGARQMKGGVCV